MRLVLRFRRGLVTGSGDDPAGAFHVFGVFGADSGRVALVLTYASGAVLELDAVMDGERLWGAWSAAGAAGGAFRARPLERAVAAPRRRW